MGILGYITVGDGQPLLPPRMKDHMYDDLNRRFEI
jgi:hypothetical protein